MLRNLILMAVVVGGPAAVCGQEPKAPPAGKDKRAAVPAKDSQEQARKLLRELFAADYARKSPADAKRLSDKLLAQARETQDDRAARYVLFQEARDAAIRAGELMTALAIVEEVSTEYVVRLSAEKLATLEAAVAPGSGTAPKAVVDAAQVLLDEVIAGEELATAADVLKVGRTAAAKAGNPALSKTLADREKDLATQRAEFEKAQAALKTLAARPDDPAANLIAGRYRCFYRGDWDTGLKMLAKGEDPKLAKLADRDLIRPTIAAERVALGDVWWDAGEAAPEPERTHLKRRAVRWYDLALPELSGLTKTKCERRVESLSKADTLGPGIVATGSKKVLRLAPLGRVEFAETVGLLHPNKEFTVELWLRHAAGEQDFAAFDDHAGDPRDNRAIGSVIGFNRADDANKFFMRLSIATRGNGDWWNVRGREHKIGGEWHHLAYCKTAEEVRLYYDGKLDFSQGCKGVLLLPGVHNLLIGNSHHWQPQNDKWGTYDLRAFRVTGKALYTKDFTPPQTFGKTKDTLLLPDFATPDAAKLTDLSGHNRHGTIVDGKWVDPAAKK